MQSLVITRFTTKALRRRSFVTWSIMVWLYRGYYTVAWRYEFYFLVAKTIFYSLAALVRKILFCHSKIKFISSSRRVIFFLLCRHADDGVFDNFPKISEHFPNISEDSPKVVQRLDKRFRAFSKDIRRLTKISKITDDFRGRTNYNSII